MMKRKRTAMKIWLTLGFGIVFTFASAAAWADDTEVANELVQTLCSNCHGKVGRSVSPTFPNLAGQKKEYIEAQIKLFREHTRADPHAQAYMWGMASNPKLTDKVIADVAKYYSNQPPAPPTPPDDPALSESGKKLYGEGDAARGVPACSMCHGDKGEGFETIPVIPRFMHQIASGLTPTDIDALSTYLASQ
jgi:cytochrome c553